MPTRVKGAQRAGRKAHNRGWGARGHGSTWARGHVGTWASPGYFVVTSQSDPAAEPRRRLKIGLSDATANSLPLAHF
jgi:hypothetical protein